MDARFIVLFDPDAVRDLESLKGKQERNAVYAVIDKLRMLGPDLAPPHVKSLKGESGLLELRPRRGRSPVQAIYPQGRERVRDSRFLVKPDKAYFGAAVAAARKRALLPDLTFR